MTGRHRGGPRRGMVLCAGRGQRLRPVTDAVPKPLIEVAGRTLLDRMLDHLAGLDLVVVNASHLGERVAGHVEARPPPPRLALSPEAVALDTGGGVAHALPHLGGGPFVVANGDILLLAGDTPVVDRLAAAWRDDTTDALLLLLPRARADGFGGRGDFRRRGDGRLWRDRGAMPFVYAGVQLVHPRLLAGAPTGAFSFNLLWDRAAAVGRLHGLVHDGAWFTVDTPANLAAAPGWLHRHER